MTSSKNTYTQKYWHHSEATKVRLADKIVLFILFVFGVASVLNFAHWWFREKHVTSMIMFAVLSLFFWYSIIRMVYSWYTLLMVSKPVEKKPQEGLSVAIFTTSYKGEPLEMVRKTLEACSRISYPHTTYLLDNTEDKAFREAAEAHGAVWLELINIPGAKAGKVNKAMSLTNEEIILILDPDHIPFPEFLDNTLGYFSDPKVGFVQVSQAYYNQDLSFIAKAAAQQTYTFYGATQMGYNGMDCGIAIGSNCTFRRSALDSIGGHVVGLAEDLQTSLKLHAAGWKSVYNPVVVSRGIVPEDFASFAKQQLKWSFGAFGVLFNDLPQEFRKLNIKQKLTYSFIATYYLSGVVSLLFTLLPLLFFATGIVPVNIALSEFIVHGFWVFLTSVLFYVYSQKWMCDKKTERGFHWQSMILTFAIWPVFVYGMLLSLIQKNIPYIPTSKTAEKKLSVFAIPFIVLTVLFTICMIILIVYRIFLMPTGDIIYSLPATLVMTGFAFMVFAMSVFSLFAVYPTKTVNAADPWEGVDLKEINKKSN